MASADPLPARQRRSLLLAAGLLVVALVVGIGALLLARGGASSAKIAARIVITSGDPAVRRGDSVTLSAFVEPPGDGAVLAIRSGGATQQHAMSGDNKGAYHHTIAANADLEYRVEAGSSASEWHGVTVIEPIGLAAGSLVEVTPPAYAANAMAASSVALPGRITGLQHSTAALHLAFTRPVADAFMQFVPEGPGATPMHLPLNLSAARDSATSTFELTRSGRIRITTVAEEKGRRLQTSIEAPVQLTVDAPPRFDSVTGLPINGGTIRPDAILHVSAAASDDIGLAELFLEYQLGENAPQKIPIADGVISVPMPKDAREGNVLRVRLRAADTRSIRNARQGSQEATFPPRGWAAFTLSASASPLERQEIQGQRDALHEAIERASDAIRSALSGATTVLAEASGGEALSVDQVVRLQNGRDQCLAAVQSLQEAGGNAALSRDLRPLAAGVQVVAERELSLASNGLLATTTTDRQDRVVVLENAILDLRSAQERLEKLRGQNSRIARHRLDRLALESVAADQQVLAARIQEGDLDSSTAGAMQQAIVDRLLALVRESEPLQAGMSQLASADARKLTQEIETLLAKQKELAEAIEGTRAAAVASIRDPLVQSQRDLADGLAASIRKLETPSRLAAVPLPRPDDLRAVADRLARGEMLEVLIDQEKLADSLERLGQVFAKWADERRDPKLAIRQLSRWQADLQTRLRDATRETPLASLPPAVRGAFANEEAALKRTLEKLTLPPNTALRESRTGAAAVLGRAVALLTANAGDADAVLTESIAILDQLSEQTPSVAERLQRGRAGFETVRTEQDAIAVHADFTLSKRATPPALMKLAALGDSQAKLAELLTSLDLPGLEPRRAAVAERMTAAAESLRQALPHDIAATQFLLKWQVERLKQAIELKTPADDAADALARRQAALAAEIAAHKGGPAAALLEKWRAAQETLTQEAAGILAPESPTLLDDVREAMRRANSALREGRSFADMTSRCRGSAEALARLAESLRGGESPLDRVRRLAARRKADEPGKLAGKTYRTDSDHLFLARLKREVDELQFVPVGPAHALRTSVLETYARASTGMSTSQAVAEALDLLAAGMEGTPSLTARVARPAAVEPASEADDFLPSSPFADLLSDLSRRQRALRERTTQMEAEVCRRLVPGSDDKLLDVIRAQRFLARDSAVLAEDLASKQSPTADRAALAAANARRAADLLRLGNFKDAEEQAREAIRQWRDVGGPAEMLVKGQEQILADALGMREPFAIAAARQKAIQEELLLQSFDVKAAVETAGRANAFTKSRAGGESSFAAAAAQIKDAATAMAALVAKLERGEHGGGERSLVTLTRALEELTTGNTATAEAGAIIDATAALRDLEHAMQAARTKLAAGSDEAGRAMDEVKMAIGKARKALDELVQAAGR